MVKNVSLAVMSLLLVVLVSGCGDSEPSSTGEPQATKKEAPSTTQQAPVVDEKTEEKMRAALSTVEKWVAVLRIDKNIQPKTLDEIYNDMIPERQEIFKQATDVGIKIEYLLVTDQKGKIHHVITAFSPDGKYKIVLDESQEDEWYIYEKIDHPRYVPLEKVE